MEAETSKRTSSPSWMAVVGMLIAPMMMVCAWMISLSNRIAVLESENSHLSTAAVQIAALTQELVDFRRQYEQDRINDRVTAARNFVPSSTASR
jgi:hypothetical protein